MKRLQTISRETPEAELTVKQKVVEAVIFPLLSEHIQRLFDGKDVFCKYVGVGKPRISIGNHILLYASGKHAILGEATILGIQYLSPMEIIQKYESRLFVNKSELEAHRLSRNRSPEKKLLVLILSNVSRYDAPLIPLKNITMAGLTLSRQEFKKQLAARRAYSSDELRPPLERFRS